MIALTYAGSQTLSFSEPIANPVFSYVSLNGNGYAFNQDFEILSVGGVDGNAPGYWGAGTSYKSVVDLGGGNFEYQLLGTGEPHDHSLPRDPSARLPGAASARKTGTASPSVSRGPAPRFLAYLTRESPPSCPFAGLLGAAAFYRRRTVIG